MAVERTQKGQKLEVLRAVIHIRLSKSEFENETKRPFKKEPKHVFKNDPLPAANGLPQPAASMQARLRLGSGGLAQGWAVARLAPKGRLG